MADDSARSRWRDALALAVLTAVLVAGLVYYGTRLPSETDSTPPTSSTTAPTPTGSAAPTPSPSPTPPVSPTEVSGPTIAPTSAEQPTGRCWDGQPTTELRACGLPIGSAGLAWVFPSFSPDRAGCRVTAQTDRAYAVTTSYTCTEQVEGRPVTLVYDEVADAAEVDAWMRAEFAASLTTLPGAHGGRLVARGTGTQPARITGTYVRLPYVVSVFAGSAEVAEWAWAGVVRQRSPRAVRGVGSGT